MGMEDEVDRHTMVAVDKSRKEGIEDGIESSLGPSTRRGSQSGAGNRQAKVDTF